MAKNKNKQMKAEKNDAEFAQEVAAVNNTTRKIAGKNAKENK